MSFAGIPFARIPQIQYGMSMEDNQDENRGWWRFFDGSVSVSASMLVAVLISKCAQCDELPVISLLKALTNEDSGIIIVATMLLFPVTLVMYGGAKLIFAAKQAVQREARERLKKQREEGRAEGRAEYRTHILDELKKRDEISKDEILQLLEDSEDKKEN